MKQRKRISIEEYKKIQKETDVCYAWDLGISISDLLVFIPIILYNFGLINWPLWAVFGPSIIFYLLLRVVREVRVVSTEDNKNV